MNTNTIVDLVAGILITLAVIGVGAYVYSAWRYVHSGEYETDNRLREVLGK